ncbi:M15 family metallopeptidase [Candidatus Babeliales bacterium]|nr:M15 family metallopeptidase [Candidatus Babeliales bacterium]
MKKIFLIIFLSLSLSTILSIETPIKSNSEEMFQSSTSSITNKIFQRMKYSWQEPAPVNIKNIRYITLNHWGFDGKIHVGEIIIHKLVADEVVEIFEELFEAMFPIERMKLVDDYQGSDDKSILANNCYALCVRYVAETNRWSKHAFGLAIDINPQQNHFYFPHRFCSTNRSIWA